MDDFTRRMLAKYKEHKDDPRVFAGSSAAVVGTKSARGAGAGILMDVEGGTLSREVPITGDVRWDTPLTDIRKRSPMERAESLANRLWQSVKDHDPAQTELVLKMLYQDSWKRGQPISYDEVKRLAIELMRQAAAKAGGPY